MSSFQQLLFRGFIADSQLSTVNYIPTSPEPSCAPKETKNISVIYVTAINKY